MTALKIIIGIVYLLVCIGLIILVLLQESKSEGVGAITGGSDTLFGKGKTNTKEGFYAKLTVVLSIAFAIIAVVFGVIMKTTL